MSLERCRRSGQRSVVILAAVLLTASTSGCWGYPKVSPQAFDTAKAVDNVCNLREPQQLEAARELIEQRAANDEITAREAKMLQAIVDQAEAGRWEAASSDARRLLEAQNEWR